MSHYRITSSAGQDLGTYEADSPEAALDAMAREAGYESQADAAETVGAFDGKVEAVPSAVVTRARYLIACSAAAGNVTHHEQYSDELGAALEEECESCEPMPGAIEWRYQGVDYFGRRWTVELYDAPAAEAQSEEPTEAHPRVTFRAIVEQSDREFGANSIVSNDRGNGSAGPQRHTLDDLGDVDPDEQLTRVSEEEDPDAWRLAREAYAAFGVECEPAYVYVSERDDTQPNPYQSIWLI